MFSVDLKILDERIRTKKPCYATEGAAGMDICACIDQSMILSPNETQLISSGISFFIRDPGYAALLLPRSGLGHKSGIILGNTIGLIDSDYQGELKVSLWNRSQEPFTLNPLDRIAQLIIVPVAHVQWNIVEDFSTTSDRASGGFGSTGQ